MTQAPHLLTNSREGIKFGDGQLVDHMSFDGLTCAFDQMAMGASTEKYNSRHGLTRRAQDEFAARSHQRAGAAAERGVFAEEIAPVSVPQRKGDPVVVDSDEGIRADTTADGLGKLRPAFAPDGTITAGSASQISDGASAVLLVDEERARAEGLRPRARFHAFSAVGDDPLLMLTAPIPATHGTL